MSDRLLRGSTSESVESQLEISRKHAVYATLGRLLCESPDRPPQSEYTTLNNTHQLWHQYSLQLGTKSKIEIPKLLTPERINHPSFTSVTQWLGSQTLKVLNQETAIRADMYESAIGYDVFSHTSLGEAEEGKIQARINQNWQEIETHESRYSPYVLAQIVSTTLLNATLHQHIREEKVLTEELQLAS